MKPLSGALVAALLLATVPADAALAGAAPPCQPHSLDFGQKAVGWAHQPLSRLKRDTVYTLAQADGRVVLHAVADHSASLYVAGLKPAAEVPASLSWRWRTPALVPGADNRDKRREDAPLRVIVAFAGDVASLPEAEQKRFRRAKSLSGRDLPYATLMYIWSNHVPVNTLIPSAHTGQVKMLVAASGVQGLGHWQAVRRNLAEDYQRAFGARPGRIIGVAVMTDSDNTGGKASGDYADIRLDCPGG